MDIWECDAKGFFLFLCFLFIFTLSMDICECDGKVFFVNLFEGKDGSIIFLLGYS
jgi:hypothetical protein